MLALTFYLVHYGNCKHSSETTATFQRKGDTCDEVAATKCHWLETENAFERTRRKGKKYDYDLWQFAYFAQRQIAVQNMTDTYGYHI